MAFEITIESLTQAKYLKYRKPQLFEQTNEADVRLVISGSKREFMCHSVLLAIRSKYFANLLTEVSESMPCDKPLTIVLNNITESLLEYLLEFIYKGKVTIPCSELSTFLQIGDLFHIYDMTKICTSHQNTTKIFEPEILLYEFPGTSIITLNKIHHRKHLDPLHITAEKDITKEEFKKTFPNLHLPDSLSLKLISTSPPPSDSESLNLKMEDVGNKKQNRSPRKYKKYSPKTLELALNLIRDGGSPLVIAKHLKIPSRTIYDRLNKMGIKSKIIKKM